MSPRRVDELPADVRVVAEAFSAGVVAALGDRILSLLLLGSVAFPGFEPYLADIDFHGVVASELADSERDALAAVHANVAADHVLGSLLDGYYIPVAKVRPRPPHDLVGAGSGVVNRGGAGRDKGGWDLERAHLHAGAFVLLSGRDPRGIYPPPAEADLGPALEDEYRGLAEALDRHPAYAALNLVRLAYSVTTGDVVVSKVAAADWALTRLPQPWHPLVRDALAQYRGADGTAGQEDFRGGVRELYAFVGAQYFTRSR